MGPKDAIRNTLDMSDMIVDAYTQDLTDDEIKIRAVEGMNSIAWQLGHLIESERKMVDIVAPGACPALPEGFAEAHTRDTAQAADGSAFLPLATYRALWKAQREATRQVIDAVADADLDRADANLPSYAPTVGAMLNMCGVHTLMHVGQWVAVRRKLGKPVTI
jgi:uncharacterized damage-inducible protein DinB